MDYRKIKLMFPELTKSDFGLVNQVSPIYLYENGVRTNKQIGFKYTTLLPNLGYEQLVVRVEESKPSITTEEIAAAGGVIKAKPINCIASFYKNNKTGDFEISAKAERMEVIK